MVTVSTILSSFLVAQILLLFLQITFLFFSNTFSFSFCCSSIQSCLITRDICWALLTMHTKFILSPYVKDYCCTGNTSQKSFLNFFKAIPQLNSFTQTTNHASKHSYNILTE